MDPVISWINEPVVVTTLNIRGSVAPIDGIPPFEIFNLTKPSTKNRATPIPTRPKRNPPTNESTHNLKINEGFILPTVIYKYMRKLVINYM